MKKLKLTALLFIQVIVLLFFQDSMYSQNNALHFDGVDDYVEIPSPIDGNGDFTFEAWFKVENNSVLGFKRIVALNGLGSRFEIGTDQEKIAYFVHPDTKPQTSHTITDNFVGDDLCHHIAAVKSGSNLIIYLDGLQVEYIKGHFGKDFTTGSSMKLGRWGDKPANHWKGQIDDVRVWSRERTPREIYEYKDKEVFETAYDLAINYKFNQGIANGNNEGLTIAHDNSPNNINGNLLNFSLNDNASNWVSSCYLDIIYFEGISHQVHGKADVGIDDDTHELVIFCSEGTDDWWVDINLGQVKGFAHSSSPPEDEINSYEEMRIFGRIDGKVNSLIRTSRDEIVMHNNKKYTKWTTDNVGVENNQLLITTSSGEVLMNINIPNNEPLYFRFNNSGNDYFPEANLELNKSRSNDDQIFFLPPDGEETDIPAGSTIEIIAIQPTKEVDYFSRVEIRSSALAEIRIKDEKLILFDDHVSNQSIGESRLEAKDGGQKLILKNVVERGRDGLRMTIIDTLPPTVNHENVWESKLLWLKAGAENDGKDIGNLTFNIQPHTFKVKVDVDYTHINSEYISFKVYDDGIVNGEDTFPKKNLEPFITSSMPIKFSYIQHSNPNLFTLTVGYDQLQTFEINGNTYEGNELHISTESKESISANSMVIYPSRVPDFVVTNQRRVVVEDPDATKEISLSNNFKVYPNPATDLITIESEDFKSGEIMVKLYDILGRSVLSSTYNSFVDKIDMSVDGLRVGWYLLEVVDGEGNRGVKGVVVE